MASIVVIDSEPTVRAVMTKILERGGYSVWATGEFPRALERLRLEQPSMVITNVFLKGIAGHDAMAAIRSEFPDLQVLMVSGLPDEELIEKWVGETGFDIFPKPFDSFSLLARVEEILGAAAS